MTIQSWIHLSSDDHNGAPLTPVTVYADSCTSIQLSLVNPSYPFLDSSELGSIGLEVDLENE